MNNKRVALFLPSLAGGGAERVLVTLANWFCQQGIPVDFVLGMAKGPYLPELSKDVRVVDLKSPGVLKSLPRLIWYLRSEHPAAMLSSLNHANIVAIWARKMSAVATRLVVREANTLSACVPTKRNIRSGSLPTLARLFYRSADKVVAVSQGVADNLIEHVRVPATKVAVIYNPVVNPGLLEKATGSINDPWFMGGVPVILGVGRLTEQKDFPTLIRAFAIVRRYGVPARLVVLGEGEERPVLEGLVRDLYLGDDVYLPGFVGNPFKYMKQAALFVLSSRWEGLPNVLIQAMAVGTPVVATDCPSGPAEILSGGKWGTLVPVQNERVLAQAIITALKSGKKTVDPKAVDRFRVDIVAKEYQKVLLGDLS